MNKTSYSSEWLKMLYERIDKDYSLTRNSFTNTHQWIVTLAIGAITAIIAFGKNDFEYPTEISLAALLVMVPLVFRFYVRSCLEYTLFHRTLTVRRALDEYLRKKEDERSSVKEDYL